MSAVVDPIIPIRASLSVRLEMSVEHAIRVRQELRALKVQGLLAETPGVRALLDAIEQAVPG